MSHHTHSATPFSRLPHVAQQNTVESPAGWATQQQQPPTNHLQCPIERAALRCTWPTDCWSWSRSRSRSRSPSRRRQRANHAQRYRRWATTIIMSEHRTDWLNCMRRRRAAPPASARCGRGPTWGIRWYKFVSFISEPVVSRRTSRTRVRVPRNPWNKTPRRLFSTRRSVLLRRGIFSLWGSGF